MKKIGNFGKEGIMTRGVRHVMVVSLFVAIVFMLFAEAAWAVPANPKPFKVKQPDGTEITLRLKGDERHSWHEDQDGYLVMKQADCSYVYARVVNGQKVSTDKQVGKFDPKTLGLQKKVIPPRKPSPSYPAAISSAVPDAGAQPAPSGSGGPQYITPPIMGVVPNLVVLCLFKDHSAEDQFPLFTRSADEFNILFNYPGPVLGISPSGSVKDYYSEASYGVLTLDSTIIGWVTLPEDQAYYANGMSGVGVYPNNAQKMVEDALEEVEKIFFSTGIDPNTLDTDGDGFIDVVDFIHSGYGAEFDGDPDKIWSHKWALPIPWVSPSTGLTVFDYHTEPALSGNTDTEITTIGVICHETGHFFGLPDLYDTDYSGSGIGSWGLMANSWGFTNDGVYPPHPCAWSKIFLGWVTPTVISSGTYIAPQVQTDPTIYKIEANFPLGEYLLIENRQQYGFERNIPHGGLAIWHIDDNKGSLDFNNVNDDEGYPGQPGWPENGRHYRVALLQADGRYDLEMGLDGFGDATDLYYTPIELTPLTVPNTDTYQDGVVRATDLAVFWISQSQEEMEFTLFGPKDSRVLNATKNIEYKQIQEAIDAASDGDEIIANSDDSYYEMIDFKGKAIFLRSGDVDNPADKTVHPENTWIVGNATTSIVTFQSGEGPDSILKGFTVTHGKAENGGGIECIFSSPVISNCIIWGNTARSYGGGIDLWFSQAVVTDCVIRDNQARSGAGICIDSDDTIPATITSCEIKNNLSTLVGGAVSCYYTSALLTNCAIAANESQYVAGSVYLLESDAEISNCTIIDNKGYKDFGGIFRDIEGSLEPVIFNSIIWNNGDDLFECSATYSCIQDDDAGLGNIHSDPQLVGPYYLSFDEGKSVGQLVDSQCFNAGNPAFTLADLGLENTTTRSDHAPDTGVVDIGYHHRATPAPMYKLRTTAINGVIDPLHPTGVDYFQYTIVELSATSSFPHDQVSRIKRWVDTDDDASKQTTNTVMMDRNRNVLVEFELTPLYQLIVVIVGTNGTVQISSAADPNILIPALRGRYYDGTIAKIRAIPQTGYRVKAWTGIDDVRSLAELVTVNMNRNRAVSVEFEPAISRNLLVPSVYSTIEAAVEASKSYDRIIVSPRPGQPYTISNPDGIDFRGRRITLTSMNPLDPIVVANTIIDCQSTRYLPIRAFQFHSGEGSDSVVTGFTIKNSWASGGVGMGGAIVNPPEPPGQDPPAPPRANSGESAMGDGYGGAILCTNGSSPTISYCVITQSTVTGGIGGDGNDGYNISEGSDIDDQSGGHGGDGIGNGYGGAIACLNGSKPNVSNCMFSDNIARGGLGGHGGNGTVTDDGDGGKGSWGGDAGWSAGDGIGGAVYCDQTSEPVFTNCTFTDNSATYGLPGNFGRLSSGEEYPDPFNPFENGTQGFSVTYGNIAGGAANFAPFTKPRFVNCTFDGNKAYEQGLSITMSGGMTLDIFEYTKGGAIFVALDSTVTLDNCTFTDNIPGAVYCSDRNSLLFSSCQFIENKTHIKSEVLGNILLPELELELEPEDQAGAVYVGIDCPSVQFTACDFRGNYAHGDAGAVKLRSNAVFAGTGFSDNAADGYGGGISACSFLTGDEAVITLGLQDCTFAGNTSDWGGGVYFKDFVASLGSCQFFDNAANSGGGLFLSNGKVNITGSIIGNNRVTNTTRAYHSKDDGIGAGIACMSTTADIVDTVIQDNAAERDLSYGGGVAFYGGGGVITHQIRNCLITGNSAKIGGGGVYCSIYALPQIKNCTLSKNTAGLYGGSVYADWSSETAITNSIIVNSDKTAVYEQQYGADVTLRYCLLYGNQGGDLFDSATGLTYTGAASLNSVPGNQANKDGNPLFASGPLGAYYLNQTLSPAVNAGSASASSLGLAGYSTDPAGALDAGVVDMGYHYANIAGLPQYNVTINAGAGGKFKVNPDGDPQQEYVTFSRNYYKGTMVVITAVPAQGYRVANWSGGTVQDGSRAAMAVVVVTANKNITVQFDEPKTLIVGSQSQYTTIQHAIDDAVDGDIVQILPGLYQPPVVTLTSDLNIIYIDKAITLTGVNPDDPEIVANTVLDQWRFELENIGPDTVFNGLTMRARYNGVTPPMPPGEGQDGTDASGFEGGVMVLMNASPTIRNCIFRDCQVLGGNGNNGSNGGASHPTGGDGGWGGRAYGGAVYAVFSSKPLFQNCTFNNCRAIGGNGGNGGNGYQFAHGGRGGSWMWAPSIENDPLVWSWWDGWTYGDKYDNYILSVGFTLYDWDTWTRWFDWGDRFNGWEEYLATMAANTTGQAIDPYDAYDEYWEYSGYGGAVYCAYDSSAKFDSCKFIDNFSRGGACGIGGTTALGDRTPEFSMRIENAGGAVYAAHESHLEFLNCEFTGNYADTAVTAYVNDYYVSFGGAVAYEVNCNVKFDGCTWLNNSACVGGALYSLDSTAAIADCNFINNEAYHGGGMYAVESGGSIVETTFQSNKAYYIQPDPANPVADVLYGQGGGYHGYTSTINLLDSSFINNQATASGGGIYLTGSTTVLSVANCLVVNNEAGRDGGGLSVNWYAKPKISNCTIVDNTASGDIGQNNDDGKGGGLYCSGNSQTQTTDSIFWGNTADIGRQIVVGNGFEFDPRPAILTISYCDIQGGKTPDAVITETGCTLNWGAGMIDGEPLFVKGLSGIYYLSQIAADDPDDPWPTQTVDSPCVNAGSVPASQVGMDKYTTRTDEDFDAFDAGVVDMGYHYPLLRTFDPCRYCDMVYDGWVNIEDFAILALNWFRNDCSAGDNLWCSGADISLDSKVNIDDLNLLLECWLVRDTNPPQPNPSEWRIKPLPVEGTGNITMTARASLDTWGWDVEYFFDCIGGAGGHDSGWQEEPEYIDTSLTIGVEYTYVVRTRDSLGNVTTDSEPASAMAGFEKNPPVPNPSLWATIANDGINGVPTATGPTTIKMVAYLSTDPDGHGPVQYYFRYTAPDGILNGTGDGHDSGWQTSPIYEEQNLTPGQTYTYRVKARDVFGNVTGESVPMSATTTLGDFAPPLPNPSQWAQTPLKQFINGSWWHYMRAVEAVDASGVEYYFECIDVPGLSSGWRNAANAGVGPTGLPVLPNEYWLNAGSQFANYSYRVRTRDQSPNQNTGDWSTSSKVP